MASGFIAILGRGLRGAGRRLVERERGLELLSEKLPSKRHLGTGGRVVPRARRLQNTHLQLPFRELTERAFDGIIKKNW